ncbi:Leucine-rich repeat, ribonuclease inhibitor subtype, partial [Globisporangium splendens]
MSEHISNGERNDGEADRCARRLVLLAAKAVAQHTPLEQVAAYLEFFPRAVRSELYAHLSDERLRSLEILFATTAQDEAKGGADWSLEQETEIEWRKRSESSMVVHNATTVISSSSNNAHKRSYRQAFWEHRFRALLRARMSLQDTSVVISTASGQENSTHCVSGGKDSDSAPEALRKAENEPGAAAKTVPVALHLFYDVVHHLKLHGREVTPSNVELIFKLHRLQRLEVHHPEQQNTCWVSLVDLVKRHQSLHELCFFHGKLSDTQLQQIRLALLSRATTSITTSNPMSTISKLELVSVKIRVGGYRELTALLKEYRQFLTDIRISSSIADFENDAMIINILASPTLKRLSLEHNDLEDDAFVGIAARRAPIALTHLKLGSNAISVATLNGICMASLDGFLKLQQLELMNNTDVGDPGIHALAPMLATGVAASTSLTHLDLYNCNFGLEGAMNLLLALGENRTLRYLDIGHNFFGSSFGDLLADFLETNKTLQTLYVHYVGLGTAGCTERLRKALKSNDSLTAVSFAANRLRDDGADLLFQALVHRCRRKTYTFVDLGGNLLTNKALSALANTVERSFEERGRAIKRQKLMDTHAVSTDDEGFLMQELGLVNNDFVQDKLADGNEVLETLQRHIHVVRTNPWAGKRNVYDDEV